MTTTSIVTDTVDSLLQAWLEWGNTYAVFVAEHEDFIELMIRTQNLLRKPELEV